MLERRFVRHGATVKPLAECDLGVVYRFSDGAQARSTIGELWVTYDVEFYLPELDSASNIGSDFFSSGAHSGAQNAWVGLNKRTDNLELAIDGLGNLTFSEPGIYELQTLVAYTTDQSVAAFPSLQYANGAVAYSDLEATPTMLPAQGTPAQQYLTLHYVNAPRAGARVSISWSPESVTLTRLCVSKVGLTYVRPPTTLNNSTLSEIDSLKTEVEDLKFVLKKAIARLALQEEIDMVPPRQEVPSHDVLE
jgi:hypothetical protein